LYEQRGIEFWVVELIFWVCCNFLNRKFCCFVCKYWCNFKL